MKSEGVVLGWRKLQGFLLLLEVLVLPQIAAGQDTILSVTAPAESVTAGNPVSLGLNVLNQSDREISWSFPGDIPGRIITPQFAIDVSMRGLFSTNAGEVRIAPGTFARREYSMPVPASVTGQVVVVFSSLRANRVVLDVQAPPRVADETATGSKSLFQRLVEEVEPVEAGRPFDPGRFFKEHISAYEPFYFTAGSKSPNAKFQISFQYQILDNEGPLAVRAPALRGFRVAYTQTSLWDWNGPSAPFFDTSYKPEFLFSRERIVGGDPTNWLQLDLQGALKHESNGKADADSRSLNIAYLRPTAVFGRDNGLQLTLQPRVWVYLGDLSDNPDIADYRGYADLRAILGWKRGLQLSALGRMGKTGNHESVQLDLTYPTMRFFHSFSVYLHAQYFTGYGESLLRYNRKSEVFRAGFSLYR